MSFNIEEYKTLYIKTAQAQIDVLQSAIQKLDTDPCDVVAITDFHRAAHTLKGQSLVMGYTKTGLAAKVLESLFAAIKAQKECITTQNMPHISCLVDDLHASHIQISAGHGESDLSKQIDALAKTTSIPLL